MQKTIYALLVPLFLFQSHTIKAQDGEGEITHVTEGASVPFDGMLFPITTAVRWRHRIELLEERLIVDVGRSEATSLIRLDLVMETLALRTEQYQHDVTLLRTALADASERKWHESRFLWMFVGVAFVSLAGLAVWGLTR